ncbi:MAG: ATP-grasp domain-containing protein [Candidatus Lokiarchaeota archaeon]|jgi:hypothetical protein
MKIGILSKRKTGLIEKICAYYKNRGYQVTIFTEDKLTVNSSLFENDFYILKSKSLLFLYTGYFLHLNHIPVIPDPIISYNHKHRVESYYSIRNCGLNPPKIYMGTTERIKKQNNSLEYPFIVKPLMGSGSKGLKIIRNSEDLDYAPNTILYIEKFIEGTHYLAYFIDDQICVGKKQPFADEHAKVEIVTPDKDIQQALMLWKMKYNLLFGHLDMIREDRTGKLIVVDPGTFPEFSNWKVNEDPVPKICNLMLKRYREKREN